MAKVYVVNKSTHDFSPAEEFGEVIFLSEGPMKRDGVTNMIRTFKEVMDKSTPEDYILLTSLTTMCVVAGAMFAHRHGRLNLLLYDPNTKRYMERSDIL